MIAYRLDELLPPDRSVHGRHARFASLADVNTEQKAVDLRASGVGEGQRVLGELMRPTMVAVLALLMLQARAAAQDAAPAGSGLVAFAGKSSMFFSSPCIPSSRRWLRAAGSVRGWATTPRELWDTRGFASLEGVVTLRTYWSTHATIGLQGDRYRLEAYTRARDMKHLDLYGLGNDTTRAVQTTFRLQHGELGGLGSVRFGPVAVGGRLGSLWADVEPGQSSADPSIEERFTEQSLPGLTTQPRFAHYQTFVNVNYPYDLNARGWTGGDYRLALGVLRDTERQQHSRSVASPGKSSSASRGVREDQRLTLHGLMTTTYTKGGKTVPFYYQETLGGAGAVREFGDEIIGTDGSKATLRGFADLRFRGPHSMLLQAEYGFRSVGADRRDGVRGCG